MVAIILDFVNCRCQHQFTLPTVVVLDRRRSMTNLQLLKGPDGPADITSCEQTPIMQQALFLLNRLNESELKLTELGRWPRKLVQDFWHKHVKTAENDFLPDQEERCPEIIRVGFLLKESGLIKMRNRRATLTLRSRRALQSNLYSEIYADLLEKMICSYCWGFEDRYPDFDFIQQYAAAAISALSSLKSPISASEIAEAPGQVKAF